MKNQNFSPRLYLTVLADALATGAIAFLCIGLAIAVLTAAIAFISGGNPQTGALFGLIAVPAWTFNSLKKTSEIYRNLRRPGAYLYTTCWGKTLR